MVVLDEWSSNRGGRLNRFDCIRMGWLLQCNTGFLIKHEPYVPCSVLLSNNYVIVKACSRNKLVACHISSVQRKNQPTSSRKALRQDVV